MNFRVLGYSCDDLTGWNLMGAHRREADARSHACERRRDYQIVAVALVRDPAHNPHLEVISANVPNPARLLQVAEFRKAATAL